MDLSTLAITVIVASIAPALTVLLVMRKLVGERAETLKSENAVLQERLSQNEKENQRLESETDRLNTSLAEIEIGKTKLEATLAELKTDYAVAQEALKKEREQFEEKLRLLDEAKSVLSAQFKNLANEILDEKSKKFTEQNKSNIEQILNPLKENIEAFEKKVIETYDKESRERISLGAQVKHLGELNRKIGEDAENLARALKGQTQAQGAWGELILETILEKSGLSEGREYFVQQTLKSEDGRRSRPDVVVRLPNKKDIVIDSKVSLVAYDRFIAAQSDDDRSVALRAHMESIGAHVKSLSSKDYHRLEGLRALDYVIMFVPIESAFSLALEQDRNIWQFAIDRNVIVATPTTLLAMLRTIENVWRIESQNQNAQEIASKAGALYDKFVAFVADLNEIGVRLGKAREAHDEATKKLTAGRGNMIARVEGIRELGAKSNKKIPEKILDRADLIAEEQIEDQAEVRKIKSD